MTSARKKKPKTVLQELFIKRVEQELELQHLSRNGLAERAGGPSQTTLNEIMNGADPRLEQVYKIATALGVQAWELLTENRVGESRQPVGNVRELPKYPTMLGQKGKSGISTAHDRRRRRA